MQRRAALILLIPFLIAWGAAAHFSRAMTRDTLLEFGEIQNSVLVRTFRNTTWQEIRPAFFASAELPRASMRSGAFYDKIDGEIRRFVAETGIVKVKLYSTSGRTVYSSENRQIGEDKSENEGVIRALKGETPSELYFRDTFSSFERETSKLNLFSTYLPVLATDGKIEAVLELYIDADKIVERLNRDDLVNTSLLGLFFFLLYAVTLSGVLHLARPARPKIGS